jgi:hypothetical protein
MDCKYFYSGVCDYEDENGNRVGETSDEFCKNYCPVKYIAIKNVQDNVVYYFGEGRLSEEIPVDAVGFMAEMLQKLGHVNPCITLEDGSKVYGCECWWGESRRIKERYKGYKFTKVDINELRELIKGDENAIIDKKNL